MPLFQHTGLFVTPVITFSEKTQTIAHNVLETLTIENLQISQCKLVNCDIDDCHIAAKYLAF